MIYRTIRMVNKTDLRTAFVNAGEIVRFEEWLGLPFEDNLQGFLLEHQTLIKLLNHYYIWFHFPMAIGLLLWLYLRHHDRYAPIRNLMAFVTFAALIIHLVFPLAPPRMMTGFVDTMREFGPSIYPANAVDGAANQIAGHAITALRLGDDRGDGSRVGAQVALAMADRDPPGPDDAVDHRHSEPLVDRCSSGGRDRARSGGLVAPVASMGGRAHVRVDSDAVRDAEPASSDSSRSPTKASTNTPVPEAGRFSRGRSRRRCRSWRTRRPAHA